MDLLQVNGNQIINAQGQPVRLRGTCVGGWMNMENFINGYPGVEYGIRAYSGHSYSPACFGPGAYPGTLHDMYWDRQYMGESHMRHEAFQYARRHAGCP